ncbi:MAG: hypothetical protein LUE98_03320, partial [Tannerellaceae bacterium]|nr:hypothetical protein [Tannerellaceae bacterium]
REINFHGDYKLLIDTIENVRKDFGYQDSIQSILLRLRADAGQYENVLYQKYKLEASEDE